MCILLVAGHGAGDNLCFNIVVVWREVGRINCYVCSVIASEAIGSCRRRSVPLAAASIWRAANVGAAECKIWIQRTNDIAKHSYYTVMKLKDNVRFVYFDSSSRNLSSSCCSLGDIG